MIRLNFDGRLFRGDILQKAHSISLKHGQIIPAEGNIIIHSENFFALSLLLRNYCGRIDLVYTDPPFNTMQDFYISDGRANSVSSIKARKAYADKMPLEKFLTFLRERLIIIHELLSERGSLYLHIDCKTGHYAKIILDEIFGAENFLNDIARIKSNPKNFHRKAWGNERDMVLFYAKNSGLNIGYSRKLMLMEDVTQRFRFMLPVRLVTELRGRRGVTFRYLQVVIGGLIRQSSTGLTLRGA